MQTLVILTDAWCCVCGVAAVVERDLPGGKLTGKELPEDRLTGKTQRQDELVK